MSEPTYQINRPVGEGNRKKFKRRLYFTLVVLFLFIIAVIILIYELSHLAQQNSKSAIGKSITTRIEGPQLYKNSYFEFYSSDKWTYDTHDSIGGRTVYLLYQDGVVADSLYVYVNQTPDVNDLDVTRALPVRVKNGNMFGNIGSISEPCGDTYSPTELKRIQNVNISSTTIFCQPDSTLYKVAVGRIGSDYNIPLVRSNGQTANYIIIYLSSSFTPDSSPLVDIMPTFKAL